MVWQAPKAYRLDDVALVDLIAGPKTPSMLRSHLVLLHLIRGDGPPDAIGMSSVMARHLIDERLVPYTFYPAVLDLALRPRHAAQVSAPCVQKTPQPADTKVLTRVSAKAYADNVAGSL